MLNNVKAKAWQFNQLTDLMDKHNKPQDHFLSAF